MASTSTLYNLNDPGWGRGNQGNAGKGHADDARDLPPNAAWLVLTHDHALDMAIVQEVLRLHTQGQPFAFLGMIGSKTKAARFRSHLRRRFPPELVNRLVCPIGLVDTESKLPPVIAISIVAQLLPLLDAHHLQHGLN